MIKQDTEFVIDSKESHNIRYTPRHKINDMSLDERLWQNIIW